MELRQVRYFLAVAEELHFGRAAEKLHIAEQPLGYQIRKLEQELGFKLLDRTTRSVSLTPAGRSFMADARKILEQAERAADSARRIAAGEAGVVRLGYESATIPSILPSFVKLFRAEYPEIDLVLVEHSMTGLKSLAEGATDACLVTRYTRLPSSFEYLPVMKDRTVVALPADHPLESRESVELAELSDFSFLGYAGTESGPANQFMSHLAADTEQVFAVSQVAETYAALLGLVAAGLGFTIVTGSIGRLFLDNVSYVPFVNPSVTVDYGLALRGDDQSPFSSSLRTVARHLAVLI